MTILQFPSNRTYPATPRFGAGWWSKQKAKLRVCVGNFLNRIGVAGAVQEDVIDDALTGNHVRVSIGSLFTVISVNGRDYYFDRLTGRFGGTGSVVTRYG